MTEAELSEFLRERTQQLQRWTAELRGLKPMTWWSKPPKPPPITLDVTADLRDIAYKLLTMEFRLNTVSEDSRGDSITPMSDLLARLCREIADLKERQP